MWQKAAIKVKVVENKKPAVSAVRKEAPKEELPKKLPFLAFLYTKWLSLIGLLLKNLT